MNAIEWSPRITEPQAFSAPYPPSWVDRLTTWVARLPGPTWTYYLGLWVLLFSLMTTVQWSQGGYPVGTFNLFHLVYTGVSLAMLLLIRFMSLTAASAMDHARPLLTLSDTEFQILKYRLTTLPARATWVATFACLSFIIPNLGHPLDVFVEAQVALTPPSIVVMLLFSVWTSATIGPVLYQMYRQMRLVNLIYRDYAQVDLFHLSPLYGFSRVTSRAPGALLLIATAFYLALPSLVNDPANVFTGLFGILLCLVVFLLPLVGAHNRLVAEKERMLSDTAQRIKSAIESLHRSVDAADWGNGEQLKETLTALDIEQKMLERIPTWPWQPETLRLLLSALFIPIMLLVTQFIIQRILRP